MDEEPRHEPARHRRAVLRHVRDRRRRSSCRRLDRAAVLRASCSRGSASSDDDLPAQMDRSQLADAARAVHRAASRRRPAPSGARSCEGTDACFAPVLTDERGRRAPAHQGARHDHRARRRRPAGARAAVLAHAAARSQRPPRHGRASTPTKCSPTGASAPTRSPSCATSARSRSTVDENAPSAGAARRSARGELGGRRRRCTVTWPSLRPGRGSLP